MKKLIETLNEYNLKMENEFSIVIEGAEASDAFLTWVGRVPFLDIHGRFTNIEKNLTTAYDLLEKAENILEELLKNKKCKDFKPELEEILSLVENALWRID